MLPHDALAASLTGHRKAVALALHVSETLVDQWCLLPRPCGGEGSPSPVQRVLEIVLTLRLAGVADSDFLLVYLCRELGYFPPVRIEAAPSDPTDVQVLAATTKEHADILATWSKALSNSALSVGEAEDFLREIRELLSVLGAWHLGLQRFLVTEESALVGRRRGPNRSLPRLITLRNRAAIA